MGRFKSIRSPTESPSGDEAREATSPLGAGHFLKQAGKAMALGQWERALKAFGRVLERDRDSEDAWAGQVQALLEMGQFDEAFTWTEQAARVVGETPRVLGLRAVCCARTGKLDDAMAWSDRAMREGGDDQETWLARAEVLFASGQDPPARRALDKAFERTPDPSTRRRCGAVALLYGDLRTAQLHLERARREAPEDPLLALHLGVLRERQGDFDAARTELDRALALAPDFPAAHLALEDIDRRTRVQKVFARIRRWLDD